MTNQEYIIQKQESSNRFSISGINVFVKDKPPKNISVRDTTKKLLRIIPKNLISNIQLIQVGKFEELEKRKIQALYKDFTITVTNQQTSNEDLLDDLVHEVAHSVEELRKYSMYSDKTIEKEFLLKRKKLWTRLESKGFERSLDDFLNVNYDKSFDEYLHQTVGYSLLASLSYDLFYSPYGATSIREYFANGFEAFFLREHLGRLKSLSPSLYRKISELL